jgi:hypothetical protein
MIVVPASPSHIRPLAEYLRIADLRELQATTAETPEAALDRLLCQSAPCLALLGKGNVIVGMFGAVPSDTHSGEAWLLGTDEFTKNPREIARLTHEWVPRLHQQYPFLWCTADARNEVHLRWLSWAGFTRTATLESYGIEGRCFHCFGRYAATPIGRRLE